VRAPAPVRSTADPAVTPAAASTALRPILTDAPRPAQLLGANSAAIWLEAADECVVLERDGVGLPNGVVTQLPLPDDATGDAITIGGGSIRLGASSIEIRRWWDPRPRLSPTSGAELAAAFEALGAPEIDDRGLEAALTARHQPSIVGSAHVLVGCGDGLTPAGDDILAGTIAALALAADADADDLGRMLVEPVLRAAEERTSLLSRSLLRHAAAGRVARPVADLFAGLTGRGDAAGPYRRMLAMGHSSGPALAAGIGIGLRALSGGTA